MELELNWEHFDHYELLLDTAVSQEETRELIVPDALADIRDIVEAGGQLFLTEKSVQDGAFSAAGAVDGWILYRPEGGEELCRMELHLPISVKTEAPGCSAEGRSLVRPTLCRLDARALNPRKVLVRADVCANLQLFQPRTLALCSGVADEEGLGVQRLAGQHSANLTTQVREKAFSVYEEIPVPAGLEDGAQLLCMDTRVWCTETKQIGNKLIFKGEAGVRLRHRNAGKLLSTVVPIGFSQVIELDSAAEQGESLVELYVTNLECTRAGEDGRTLNITLDLMAQAAIVEQISAQLLQDAYSTTGDLSVEMESCQLSRLAVCATKPQSVRELMETPVQAKSVIDATVRVCSVNQVRQDDYSIVQAQILAEVLYLDEQDQVQCVAGTIVVAGQPELPEQGACSVSCVCPGEVFAAVAAGGIEVRFNLAFRCVLNGNQAVQMVKQARWTERSREEGQRRPSVVLRMPLPGERLWDIAKAYGTTTEQICQANALEEASLPTGRMLLIPSGC